MSLTFKSDKEQPKEQPEQKDIELYDVHSSVRNVCFIQADGKRMFLNYAYLVSGEYTPDESSITLAFTTHTVTLKGSNLEGLFGQLMNHELKRVQIIDKRYTELNKTEKSVSSIIVNQLKN